MRSTLALGSVLILAAACAGTSTPAPSTPAPRSASLDPIASPVISGQFPVSDGRKLAIECWGEGSPTVILVGGHPSSGIADFRGTSFLRHVAEETRVCAYARSGYEGSDPPPNEPRDAEDVITDLKDLLDSSGIDGPYVLVGESFGGFIVTYFAARHPDDVAGVVLLEAPTPSAELTLDDIPEIAWDHPENPERLDIIPEFEGRFARERLPIAAPLTVVTASAGDSSVDDQRTWLDISPEATQVVLVGGHEIYLADADGSAGEVLKLVEASR